MDKAEYGMKIEQMNRLYASGAYEEAAAAADKINWRKARKWSELSLAKEIYEKAGRLKDARTVCIYAYNRNLGGRRLVYMLSELSVALNDLEEAEDLYKEFIDMAPHDMGRYILLYRINRAKGIPASSLIPILEEYKEKEMDEQYGYELAELYAEAGRTEECIKECDDLILWFNDGEYVEKALNLKQRYTALTPSQEEKLQLMNECRKAGSVYEQELPDYEEETSYSSHDMKEITGSEIEDYHIPVPDSSIYDTRNLQEELAASMKLIMSDMDEEERAPGFAADYEEDIREEMQEPESEEFQEEITEPEAEESQEETAEPEAEESQEREYETVISEELAASAEPVNVDVIEIQRGHDDEVDEPTREIIINTHRWNSIKSVMEESKDETGETLSAMPQSMENDSRPVQLELKFDEPVIEGQIDIMHYLEHMNDCIPEPESGGQEDDFEKIVREAAENGELEEEEALNRLTERLLTHISEEDSAARETASSAEEEEIGLINESVMKYVKKYLFMEGMELAIEELLNGKKNEIPDGTSRHGNIIIKGKPDTDKTGFAINIFKALHADEEQQELRIAKTTSDVLNKKGIMASADKIKGTTLIIENADRLNSAAAEELNEFMEGSTESMLVIFTGEEYYLKKLFRSNPSLRKKFDYKLELKHYSVVELVEIAREYARVRGYAIDEKALPELYMAVGALNGDDEGSEIEKVKKIVDGAIIKNGRPSRNFFGKQRKGLILLKEKHFMQER